MPSIYETMPRTQLESEIDQLRRRLKLATTILRARQNPEIPAWECNSCGLRSEDGDEISRHLVSVHHYPEEDANLSTIKIYL